MAAQETLSPWAMILDFKPVGACAQSCDSNRFVKTIQEQGFTRLLLIIQSASIYFKHVGRSKEKFLDKFLCFAELWDLGKGLKESIHYHTRYFPWHLGKKFKGKDTLEVVSLYLLSLDSKCQFKWHCGTFSPCFSSCFTLLQIRWEKKKRTHCMEKYVQKVA